MKKILHVILISLFSLTIISCAKKSNTSSSSSSEGSAVTTLAGTGSYWFGKRHRNISKFFSFPEVLLEMEQTYMCQILIIT